MADLLVKLYTLPDVTPHLTALRERGIHIRPAHLTEGQMIAGWVREHFSEGWAPAAAISAARQPSSCYLAVEKAPRPSSCGHLARAAADA